MDIPRKKREKGGAGHEDDLSAQPEAQKKSPWLQNKNEDGGRKKSNNSQKSKRKKSVVSISNLLKKGQGIFVSEDDGKNPFYMRIIVKKTSRKRH